MVGVKHAAAGTPRQAIKHIYDCLSAELMAIFKKKEDERVEKSRKAEKKAKQAEKLKLAVEKKSTRKRRGV